MPPPIAIDEVSENMRIVVSPDELRVNSISSYRRPFQIVVSVAAALYCVIVFSQNASAFYDDLSAVLRNERSLFSILPEALGPLLVLALFGTTIVQWLGRPTETLRCTHQALELTRTRSGKILSHAVYPISDSFSLQYGVVSRSGKSAIFGMFFSLKGDSAKTAPRHALEGLKVVEAQKILSAMQALGVPILRDPAERMLVEMEQSRRKFFGGIFTS